MVKRDRTWSAPGTSHALVLPDWLRGTLLRRLVFTVPTACSSTTPAHKPHWDRRCCSALDAVARLIGAKCAFHKPGKR